MIRVRGSNWKKVDAVRKHPSKIWFPSKTEELRGFKVLLNSGIPTYATNDNKYVINEFQYDLLKENEIKFRSD
jgi:hypothetical protein